MLVVIPALNEARTVERVIRRIPQSIDGVAEIRTTVIDDGSTDATAQTALRCGAKVFRHEQPRGIGRVFRRALERVVEEGADVLVYLDGDGQFNSRDIRPLVRPILDGQADCVIGRRFGPGCAPQRMDLGRRLGNRGMAWLMSLLTRQHFYDAACGFRAYSAETAMRLNLTGRFTYTQEALLDMCFKDLRVAQAPVRVRGTRQYGRSRVAHSLFQYGWRTIMIIGRAMRDYRPLRFFGTLGATMMLPGLALGAFLLWHRATSGQFTPHIWAGCVGAFLTAGGAMTLLAGLLADMLDRVRLNQEETLYNARAVRHAAQQRKIPGDTERPA